jgi:predicted GTPase
MRQDVWFRELEEYGLIVSDLFMHRLTVVMFSVSSLQNQGTPTTLIALCGATGAGKSSILNAVLDGELMICM